MIDEIFMDGNRVTPGTEKCVCGPECEFPCWQRLGLTDQPCCPRCVMPEGRRRVTDQSAEQVIVENRDALRAASAQASFRKAMRAFLSTLFDKGYTLAAPGSVVLTEKEAERVTAWPWGVILNDKDEALLAKLSRQEAPDGD